jgi:hypothetical protein
MISSKSMEVMGNDGECLGVIDRIEGGEIKLSTYSSKNGVRVMNTIARPSPGSWRVPPICPVHFFAHGTSWLA